MKKLKKYLQFGLPFLMLTALILVAPVQSAEARTNTANQAGQLNQIRIQNMSHSQLQQMVQLLTQLRTRLQQLVRLRDQIGTESDSELEIATRTAIDIETDEATLRGTIIDFGNADYVDVWFEYDTDADDLGEDTNIVRINEDEDEDFEQSIYDLDENTRYYFRAVGEDDKGEKDYGSVISFQTDEESSVSEPRVSTNKATSIEDDSAVLRGVVDMYDFENGEVFFVYGEDEGQIEDVENDFDSYGDVDEDGDDLQKILVDSNLDNKGTYAKRVTNLDDNTEHYFSICVGYRESEDVLTCGGIRTFITD